MVALPAAAALFERGDVRTTDSRAVVRYTTDSCIEVIRKSGDLPTAERLGTDPAAVFEGPVELALARCRTRRARAQARRGEPKPERHRRTLLENDHAQRRRAS